MSLLKKIKTYFNSIKENVVSIYTNLKKKLRPTSAFNIPIDPKVLKMYHHDNFSNIFIYFKEFPFSNDILVKSLNKIFNDVKENLKTYNLVLFNIVIKFKFRDDLNLVYHQSITYKELFSLKDIPTLISKLENDTQDLLNQYKDSSLEVLEIRIDYINKNSFV